MSRIVYSLSTSLDGYIVDAEGRFDWSVPDEEVFALAMEEVQGLGAHLLGRRLYETMVYWETADRDPDLDFAEAGFGRLWRALLKLVFSSTLTEVIGNSELTAEPLAEAVARLRSEHPDVRSASEGPDSPPRQPISISSMSTVIASTRSSSAAARRSSPTTEDTLTSNSSSPGPSPRRSSTSATASDADAAPAPTDAFPPEVLQPVPPTVRA